jgi:hypothetical protein
VPLNRLDVLEVELTALTPFEAVRVQAVQDIPPVEVLFTATEFDALRVVLLMLKEPVLEFVTPGAPTPPVMVELLIVIVLLALEFNIAGELSPPPSDPPVRVDKSIVTLPVELIAFVQFPPVNTEFTKVIAPVPVCRIAVA